MAAKISTELRVKVVLIPEDRGIFDVIVDENLVYSKYSTGTFPGIDLLGTDIKATLSSK